MGISYNRKIFKTSGRMEYWKVEHSEITIFHREWNGAGFPIFQYSSIP